MKRLFLSIYLTFHCVYGLSLPSTITNKDVNFVDWITSAPDEISEWKQLTDIEGTLPTALPSGTLIRNGAGLWELGEHTQYSHIFDGLAKLSGYRWDGQHIYFQTKFIQTNFYKKVKQKARLVPTISTGSLLLDKKPLEGTWWQIAQAIYHSVTFDNTCVNVWQYDPQGPITAVTDAPPRSQIHAGTLDTLSSSSSTASPLQKGPRWQYEFLETAHPAYSWTDASVTYNVAVTLTPQGPQLVLVHEQKGVRTVVGGSVPSPDGVPYVHSFGLSDRHAIVVVQPLRINVQDIRKMITDGFLRSMEEKDTTRIVVWDLETEQIVLDQAIDEKIFFYHTVSATCENDTVRIRVCAYRTPDIITSEDHFMRLEQCQVSREARNRISRGGTFCDVICDLSAQQVQVRWIPTGGQGFELPTTRYSRQPGNPRYVYAYGTYFGGSDEYDAWGLIKYEPDQSDEKKRIAACFREESVYPSEPVFVPLGDDSEDDGILLSQIYDGKRRETALLMLDARTMKVLCKVWTGQRSAMDFHGWWYPENDLRFRA